MIDPGVYPDLSNEDYHADPALGKTMLDYLARSPAHFKAYLEESPEPTPAFAFGAAFHMALLQPRLFNESYAIMPQGMKGTTKEGKSFVANANEKGLTLLSYEDDETISGMVAAVAECQTARNLLFKGESEVSYFWRHELDFMCKCRPDHVNGDIVVEVKTAVDASPGPFSRAMANYRYHWQAWWTIEGLRAHGIGIEHYVIVAIEKAPPYGIGVYKVDENDIYLGGEEIKPLLHIYRECLEKDEWPCYPDAVQPIMLPGWYLKRAQL